MQVEQVKKLTRQMKIEKVFHGLTILCSSLVLVIMLLMFFQLIYNSRLSIQEFGINFIFSSTWNPATHEYGALASIYGTVISTLIALIIAVPMGIIIALFLVEISHPFLSKVVGNAIELLAAIPSIIYGMWGLFVFSPFLADYIQPFLIDHLGDKPLIGRLFQGAPMGIGMLSAGLILALMILPFITAVTRDVFRMVPSVIKESSYGMGSTTWEVTRKITIPYGIKGVVGACFIGLGRALGETMAVTFVIGNSNIISPSLMDPAASIASTLANEFGEASEPIYLHSLMQLGLILLIMTFIIQLLAQLWVGRIKKSMGAGL